MDRFLNHTKMGLLMEVCTSKIQPRRVLVVASSSALEKKKVKLRDQSVPEEIIVVICPTLCSCLAFPDRRSDLRKMLPRTYVDED